MYPKEWPCTFCAAPLTSWQPRERGDISSHFLHPPMASPFQSQGILAWVNVDESRLQSNGMDLGQTFVTFRALHLLAWVQKTCCTEQSSIFLLFSHYLNLLVLISVYFSQFLHSDKCFMACATLLTDEQDKNNRYSCLWNWIPKLNWNETIYTRQLKEVIKSFSCHHRHHIVPFCKFSKLHLKSSWIFSFLYSCWKAVTESNCSQWLGALF